MYIFGLVIWLVCLPLQAMTQIASHIYDIDHGKENEETLIFLDTGQVVKLADNKSEILIDLVNSKKSKEVINIHLDQNRYITKVEKINTALSFPNSPTTLPPQEPLEYIPTTIASMNIAKAYHREARYNPKDSQCFNRAMVWTYEWWKKHSLKSIKILIYFSRTYIRRYNFEWWFHIAPMVHVMDNGIVVERVMDVKYGRGPQEFGKWTNLFMRNDAPCMMIDKFSDYADYPYTGECFLQRTSMYTYQPADLQMHEAWNYTKDKFLMTEVRQAYLEAFDETI